MLIRNSLILGGLALSASSFALPLININLPIADVLKPRQALLQYTIGGNGEISDARWSHLFSATVGVYENLELGVNHDTLGNGSWDAKYGLYSADWGAVSVGFASASGKEIDPYVVGRYDWSKDLRFHAGVIRNRNVATGYLGADYNLGNGLLAQFEYSSRPDGSTWIGATWTTPIEGLAVQVAYGRSHQGSGSSRDNYFAWAGYTVKF